MTDTTIDRAVFSELEEATGPDFVADLVATFLDEAPGMIADLREAALRGDTEGLRRAAHSIKSNASTFGATRLAAAARDIELRGLDTGPGDPAVARLQAECDRASASLKALLDG